MGNSTKVKGKIKRVFLSNRFLNHKATKLQIQMLTRGWNGLNNHLIVQNLALGRGLIKAFVILASCVDLSGREVH